MTADIIYFDQRMTPEQMVQRDARFMTVSLRSAQDNLDARVGLAFRILNRVAIGAGIVGATVAGYGLLQGDTQLAAEAGMCTSFAEVALLVGAFVVKSAYDSQTERIQFVQDVAYQDSQSK